MTAIFWVAAGFLIYTFAGYPLLLSVFSWWFRRPHQRAAICPRVSLIVAAHNEAAGIADKIRNCLELTYPAEKREIIIVSDGSTDATADIVRSFEESGVRLIELPERRGKHHAQMIARNASDGEILVFSDSSVRLQPDALQTVVSNFADASIGCVSSEDRVMADQGSVGEGSYIDFEMWLRRLEARVGSLVGASGSFFAARRELCEQWHPGQSSDFFIPLHVAKQGLRTVVDIQSVGYYGLTRSERSEFHRKVRTIVHGLDVFFTHLELLNPLRYGLFSWQLASHKLARWMAPFALVALLVSNFGLWNAGRFYRTTLVLQVVLYGIGLLGLAFDRLHQVALFRLATFFLMGNAATLTAWFKFSLGEKFVTWEPTPRG